MNDRKYFGGRENVDICRASGAPLLISYSIGVYCLSCFQAPLWALLFFPFFLSSLTSSFFLFITCSSRIGIGETYIFYIIRKYSFIRGEGWITIRPNLSYKLHKLRKSWEGFWEGHIKFQLSQLISFYIEEEKVSSGIFSTKRSFFFFWKMSVEHLLCKRRNISPPYVVNLASYFS